MPNMIRYLLSQWTYYVFIGFYSQSKLGSTTLNDTYSMCTSAVLSWWLSTTYPRHFWEFTWPGWFTIFKLLLCPNFLYMVYWHFKDTWWFFISMIIVKFKMDAVCYLIQFSCVIFTGNNVLFFSLRLEWLCFSCSILSCAWLMHACVCLEREEGGAYRSLLVKSVL